MFIKAIEYIGKKVKGPIEEIGLLLVLFYSTLKLLITPPLEMKNILKQMLDIGVNSLPVVLITAIFTGMVLALQSYTGFKRFGAEGLRPRHLQPRPPPWADRR